MRPDPRDYTVDDLALVYSLAGLTREIILERLRVGRFPPPTHAGTEGEPLWSERCVLDVVTPSFAIAEWQANHLGETLAKEANDG